MDKGKPVGIWIRVSTEDLAKWESTEHQEEHSWRYSRIHGNTFINNLS